MRAGVVAGPDGQGRCWWGAESDDYRAYHDDEWGFPVTDDRRLFEKICLEGFQSGLSWLTILRKRENFREAFRGFAFEEVARFTKRDVTRLMKDAGIVRHRGKIESTINNAQRACALVEECGSLAAYFWQFEPPARERPRRMTKGALTKLSKTPASTALSKDLKKRGWSYVGPTTAYAFMQAMGLVNDHLEGCRARAAVEKARGRFTPPRLP
ncbi:MAG: DNA-3-methyladenine glycosylase I [Akkermansiaceae bacterium]|nr:DNA-3-methyladenine glycosylase I [Akkermansiaceae bacterium]